MGAYLSVSYWAVSASVLSLVIFTIEVLLQHRRFPDLGLKVAAINTALYPMKWLGIGPFKFGPNGKLQMDKIMKAAMADTKLTDFGDLSFAENYERVQQLPIHMMNRYSNFGFVNAAMEMTLVVARRLRLVDYCKRHPDVMKVPLRSPVFVFGIGRSGTTFTQRLLSLDPQSRGPLLWELLNPVPGRDTDSNSSTSTSATNWAAMDADRAARTEAIRQRIEQRKNLGISIFDKFHELGHDLHEECLFALSDVIPTMPLFVWAATLGMKEYLATVTESEIVKAYESYKRFLQLLSYQASEAERSDPRRWVMKCPLHIMFIKQLAKVFPDAKLVWAHRHPYPTASSACSMLRAMHELYFEDQDGVDPMLGGQVLNYCSTVLGQAEEDIKTTGLPCAHVNFDKLSTDPIGMVRDIYATFGWEVSKEYEAALTDYLAKDKIKREEVKKRTAGVERAVHTPEDFRLTKEGVNKEFAGYINKYKFTASK